MKPGNNWIESMSTAINQTITKIIFSKRMEAYENAVLDPILGTVDKPKLNSIYHPYAQDAKDFDVTGAKKDR